MAVSLRRGYRGHRNLSKVAPFGGNRGGDAGTERSPRLASIQANDSAKHVYFRTLQLPAHLFHLKFTKLKKKCNSYVMANASVEVFRQE